MTTTQTSTTVDKPKTTHCLHCQSRARGNGTRGLCHPCYRTVRDDYPQIVQQDKLAGKEAEVEELYRSGMSVKEMARQLNCHPKSVYAFMHVHGIKVRKSVQWRGELADPYDTGEPDPRPEREDGDADYRCLWCMRWRCHRPLKLCACCQHQCNVMRREAEQMFLDFGETGE